MKVVFGKHLNEKQEKIRFWKYDEDKFRSWEVETSNYAIVKCCDGVELIKIVGFGVVKKDESEFVTKDVVKFIEIEEDKDGC